MGLFDNDEKKESQEVTPEIEEKENEEINEEPKEETAEDTIEEVTATEETPETIADEEDSKAEDGSDEEVDNESVDDESDDVIGDSEDSTKDESEPEVVEPEKVEPEVAESFVQPPEPEGPVAVQEPVQVDGSKFEERTLLKCRACKHRWFALKMEECPFCGKDISSIEIDKTNKLNRD